jgi:hypothetical protein
MLVDRAKKSFWKAVKSSKTQQKSTFLASGVGPGAAPCSTHAPRSSVAEEGVNRGSAGRSIAPCRDWEEHEIRL